MQRKRPRPLAKLAHFPSHRRALVGHASSATLLEAPRLLAIPIAINMAVGLIKVVWSQKSQSPTAAYLPSIG